MKYDIRPTLADKKAVLRALRAAPREHDYGPGHRRWGHDVHISVVNGRKVSVTGWGTGIREGDFVLLPNPANPTGVSRYRVRTISYHADPQDMWHATMVHSPL